MKCHRTHLARLCCDNKALVNSSSIIAKSHSSTTTKQVLNDAPSLKDFLISQRSSKVLYANLIPVPENSLDLTTNKPRLPNSRNVMNVIDTVSLNFYIETYGCQMNSNDSEIVRSILLDKGHVATTDIDNADVILTNTCAIRENAENKVWHRLAYFQSLRNHPNNKKIRKSGYPLVGVLGCMAERLKTKLLEGNKVDFVCGPDAYRDIPRLIDNVVSTDQKNANTQLSFEETYADISPVRIDANSVSAYVSIMRGCNNMCSFCIVPFTRGRERSRECESIVREVRNLVNQGVREVVLLGQNVNGYHDIRSIVNNSNNGSSSNSNNNNNNSINNSNIESEDDGGNASVLSSSNPNDAINSNANNNTNNTNTVNIIMTKNSSSRNNNTTTAVTTNNNNNSNHNNNNMNQSDNQANVSNSPSSSVSISQGYKSTPGFTNLYHSKAKSYDGVRFADLLIQLAAIHPELRIRFTSPHPKDFPLEVLTAIAETPNICKSIHIPLQSGNNQVLSRMRRGYTQEAYLNLIHTVRTLMPQITISTDIIAGFCDETETEHEDTLKVLQLVQYDQAFMYAYSLRDKTHAARVMSDNIPQDIKNKRLQEIIATFRSGMLEKNKKKELGRVRLVLIEGYATKSTKESLVPLMTGRTDGNKRVLFPAILKQPLQQQIYLLPSADITTISSSSSSSSSSFSSSSSQQQPLDLTGSSCSGNNSNNSRDATVITTSSLEEVLALNHLAPITTLSSTAAVEHHSSDTTTTTTTGVSSGSSDDSDAVSYLHFHDVIFEKTKSTHAAMLDSSSNSSSNSSSSNNISTANISSAHNTIITKSSLINTNDDDDDDGTATHDDDNGKNRYEDVAAVKGRYVMVHITEASGSTLRGEVLAFTTLQYFHTLTL